MCVQKSKNTFFYYKNRDFLELILRNFAFDSVFSLKSMGIFVIVRFINNVFFNSMALNLEIVKVVYFDLDNTLVNHSDSEDKALTLFFHTHSDKFLNTTFEIFVSQYKSINQELWKKLGLKEVTVEEVRTKRFLALLEKFSSKDNLNFEHEARMMGIQYLEMYDTFWELFEGAAEVIEATSKNIPLGLLSNGFRKQVLGKVKQFEWENTFRHIIISEDVGVMKPHREIFDHALRITGHANPQEMLYIGDHYESDIIGASQAGWQTVWVNLHGELKIDSVADAEVSTIGEVRKFFTAH